MRWLRRVSVMVCGVLLAGCLSEVPALANAPVIHPALAGQVAPSTGHSASPGPGQGSPGPTRLANPAKVLPSGWQHSSDEAVTVSGDSTGLHVLAATESSGYAWRMVATLGQPGVETSLWIGQACVTASGRYAVVVYAPEQVSNMAGAQGVLGRAAVVDLRSGSVRELGGGFSVAYFDPGCGTGSKAVLTRGGWSNDGSGGAMTTSLVVADAATGKVSAPVKAAGQVTSAVPYGGQIAAVTGRGVEKVNTSGQEQLLAKVRETAFRLVPGADGSLGYQTMAGEKTGLWRLSDGRARMVASAAVGSVELTQTGGRVSLIGPRASKVAGLPAGWRTADVPVTSNLSTTGTLAVTGASAVAPVKGQRHDPGVAQPVAVSARLLRGKGGTESFKVAVPSQQGLAPNVVSGAVRASAAPASVRAAVRAGTVKAAAAGPVAERKTAAAATGTTGSSNTPVSADRTCAIPLDDPAVQAYQPTFKQVEWAADQAVQGTLTDTRPAGLYGSSLASSYTPQGMFPLPSVDGGGSLPAQVLLGVLTQESNLQQASQHVIQGQASNPLTSFNWYGNWSIGNGTTTNTGLINWSNSDCGYGIGQITSGMCLAQGQNNDNQCEAPQTLTSEQKLAVSIDYQANIAAAAQQLVDEWNTLWELGIRPDGPGVPSGASYANYIGAWYMAIWAYNSGIEPGTPKYGNTTGCTPGPSCTDNGGSGGNWGLGYADNPINPAYPPDRPVFPGASSARTPDPSQSTYTVAWDMSHPEYWTYEEKVISWGFDSITLYDYTSRSDVQAFAYAHGNAVQVPYATFCTTSVNNCDSSGVNYTSATANDSCLLTNDHCWWNQSASFPITGPTSSCTNCGTGVNTYAAGAADPGQPGPVLGFEETCNYIGPSNTVIVGDGGQAALGCPGQNWTSQGSFTWNFAEDTNGNYSSKIDFDQIGAGFGGHFWFGYAQASSGPADTVISGTWNPPTSVSGWTDVQVQIPNYGANASGAVYQISPGPGLGGWDVTVNQGDYAGGVSTWVDLGQYDLGSGATVTLSNVTDTPNPSTGVGSDLAWSAAAFTPVSGPSYDYASLGDSYASGEGNAPYDSNSNTSSNSCHRSPMAYGRQFAANDSSIGNAGIQHIACSGATIANVTSTPSSGESADQISQMSTSVKLATVTIGGNDVGFARVLTNCLTSPTTCENTYNSDDGNNEYTLIDSLRPKLAAAYTAMKQRAPDAKIVAVTYPSIFQPGATCAGINNIPINDVEFLISLNYYLDNTIIEAARDAGIYAMDERYAFLGHELCSSDPWVYSLPVPFPSGTQVLDTSAWFHPTGEGHAQMATDLETYWQALQSRQSAMTRGAASKTAEAASATANAASGWTPVHLWPGLPTVSEAQEMLAEMARTSVLLTGYDDSNPAWNWVTRDGCDTRNRVLRRDAVSPSQWTGALSLLPSDGSCPVTQGSWQTPYDLPQSPLSFTDQPSIASAIAIDHVVPKANAWATGAGVWEKNYGSLAASWLMKDFSNDMSAPELLAVSSTSNSAKADRSPDQWMPANLGMTCPYVEAWIEVKYKYDLAISTATDASGTSELTFLQNTLASCSGSSGGT